MGDSVATRALGQIHGREGEAIAGNFGAREREGIVQGRARGAMEVPWR